ncbi:MAG: hypothetical protein ACI92Z_002550 [Paracoccaceae bacterium]|jgi:uncharacterized protein involved in exopolysaccharide biosynthesis
MGPIHSFDDILDMMRRRAPVMLFVICLGAIVSLWVALNQSHLYSSSEVIQIARPKIADELAPSTVAGSSARRLQLIQQRLMARDSLLRTIDEFGLYADLPGLRPIEKVNLLRQSIQIRGVAAVREGFSDDGTISVLTITATMQTPEQAQAIAHAFAKRTIELSVNSRIAQARETLDFFVLQEEKLTARVVVLESRVTDFRIKNDISIVGAVEFRRSEIATINSAILDIDRQHITLQREAEQIDGTVRQATATRLLADLQDDMDGLDAQKFMLTDRKLALEQVIETNPQIQQQLATFERQLGQMQAQLDVISVRRAEADVGFRLEAERQSERLTVLEPAPRPDYPVTSSRKKMALLGVMASIVAAFGVALLLDLRNPVIRTASQMQRELGFIPVVSIPFLDDADNRPGVLRRLLDRFRFRRPNNTQG